MFKFILKKSKDPGNGNVVIMLNARVFLCHQITECSYILGLIDFRCDIDS